MMDLEKHKVLYFIVCILFAVIVEASKKQPTISSNNEVLPGRTQISDILITSHTFSRFATVNIRSKIMNDAVESRETVFSVQLPEEAFITEFKMENENRTLYGVIKEKKKAQEAYDRARDLGQSAGHIQQISPPNRHMKIFSISMNVAAQSETTFELKYQEQLIKRFGEYTHKLHIEPQQYVPNITLRATYEETEGIGSFSYSLPGSKEHLASSSSSVQLMASLTKRTVLFQPLLLNPNKTITGDFTVTYTVSDAKNGGRLVLTGDTFLHYFTPNDNKITPLEKNIVFVVDVSGSMSGNKIVKTREAMYKILDRLNTQEIFNIIIFNEKVKHWQRNAQRAYHSNVHAAKGFVAERVQAGGSTNINEALLDALDNLLKHTDKRRASIIVFLTDGQPTSGEVSEVAILNNIKRRNEGQVSIFCLGFGFHMNFEFLKKIAYQNGGTAHRIWDEDDSNTQLVTFYKNIENVALRDVRFQYPENEIITNDVTETEFPLCFAGSEIIVAGKLKPSTNMLTATVIAVGGNKDALYTVTTAPEVASQEQMTYFDRVWAFKKIKQYLIMAMKTDVKEKKSFYEKKALHLSLTYKFVSPLTSMVVTESLFNNEPAGEHMSEKRKFIRAHAKSYSPGIRVHMGSQSAGFGSSSRNNPSIILVSIVITALIFMS